MTKDECWQKFSESGRIADYLAYAGVEKEKEGQVSSREDYSNTYAGVDQCNGDDLEIGTYR